MHRAGKAPRPDLTERTWIEDAAKLAKSGYDLSPKNTNRMDAETLPHPTELTAMLLERSREFHSILDRLHEMVSNGEKA